jgi:hypothetical protein
MLECQAGVSPGRRLQLEPWGCEVEFLAPAHDEQNKKSKSGSKNLPVLFSL